MKSNPLSSTQNYVKVRIAKDTRSTEGRPPNRPSIYIENAIGGRRFQ